MKKWLVILSSLLLAGCHFPASSVIEGPGGRNAYNIEVQKTNAEEMLLNLVRLRYYDTPFFLEVSSVTSQFTFKNLASATIRLPGFNQTNPMLFGGETQWQNQPTIQYSPLEGQEFANQLMQPLHITTLQQVIYTGWDIETVFRLAVQNIKEYHNTPKEKEFTIKNHPRYEKFVEVIKLLKILQEEDNLQVGIADEKEVNGKYEATALQIAFPSDDENGKKLADLLEITAPHNGKYVVDIVQGFDKKGNIGILPRSILSCMYNLSHMIQVPTQDIEDKKTDQIEIIEEENGKFNLPSLVKIYSCNLNPKDTYIKIKYRDNWFYIKDDDIYSKRTFMLLLELYNLQSGRRKDTGPILTLPIGG